MKSRLLMLAMVVFAGSLSACGDDDSGTGTRDGSVADSGARDGSADSSRADAGPADSGVNPCSPNPCLNGGACALSGSSFTCACLPGFTGATCMNNLCSPNPCQNGGTCSGTEGNYQCTCPNGYSGTDCETNVDDCTDNPCMHGTCVDGVNGYTCSCTAGYYGANCDTACTQGHCTGTVMCDQTGGGNRVCGACATGYTGGDCETDIDECAAVTNPCENGGTCMNSAGGFSCTCAPGFDGATCSNVTVTSCAQLRTLGVSTSGDYKIDRDGSGPLAPLTVHCDMVSDDGVGYTMVRINNATTLLANQDAYRAACAAVGMELIVPRTRAHALAIQAWNGNQPPNIVGVYPKTNGAVGLSNWEGLCAGTRGCSFWLSNGNNSDCMGNEPNGDNSTQNAIYRFGTGCDYGRWNDANNAVSIPGWVICSPNEVNPAPQNNCLDILEDGSFINASSSGINGVYTLDPDGNGSAPTYRAYCDMTTWGGGWTLALKANGTASTFSYDSAFWTNTTNLSEDKPDYDRNEAKLNSFNTVPVTEIMVGMEYPIGAGAIAARNLPVPATGASLQAIFTGKTLSTTSTTAIGRANWKSLFAPAAGAALQNNCNAEGIDVGVTGNVMRARIGIVGNQEANCGSPDSAIGVGLGLSAGNGCGITSLSVGNTAGCTTDTGATVNFSAFSWVWVRDLPIRRNCKAIQTAGSTRSGIHMIDPDAEGPSLPFPVYCDMTTDPDGNGAAPAGGWTLVALNGNTGRPTHWLGNNYPRPGASLYGSILSAAADIDTVKAGTAGTATSPAGGWVQWSIDAADLYATTSREILAYVGGTGRDFFTGTLPSSCNFFDGSMICSEADPALGNLTLRGSNGTIFTSTARACTTAAGVAPWASDTYNEFGLHIIDGDDIVGSLHCHQTASTSGFQGIGRLYTTFNSSNGTYWNTGVHSYWRNPGTLNQPGFLMIR